MRTAVWIFAELRRSYASYMALPSVLLRLDHSRQHGRETSPQTQLFLPLRTDIRPSSGRTECVDDNHCYRHFHVLRGLPQHHFPVGSGLEGCILIGVFMGMRAYLGAGYFTQPSMWPQYEVRTVIVAGFCLASMLNGAWNVYRVITQSGKAREAVESTLAFWYFQGTLFVLYAVSPAQVMWTHTRWIMMCVGCLFAREMGALQLAHVAGETYRPLGVVNYCLLTSLMLNTITNYLG